ncbi:GATA type transcriptional activator of nitrogen-regulated proteins [Coemansia spiralis]|uniref:GATA type transcriptional activator of nitrogen-regulated proteins n=2 Tax=Coemansia TaxID=4863 RepID=A0A9W8L1A3_9FUNG|nr:GATA type transcriptional activator of nitrogen-regulated proteins [Coemansia umbellata]KAJ2625840.1 GATA type transcriptional activator of nitrogen-regulated proteins [Coemansia sp. RSA 1358]KAJ2680962.1 GATA type transcriptional activator of nitrogen-regulated proteins [Coemansia spiralis]
MAEAIDSSMCVEQQRSSKLSISALLQDPFPAAVNTSGETKHPSSSTTAVLSTPPENKPPAPSSSPHLPTTLNAATAAADNLCSSSNSLSSPAKHKKTPLASSPTGGAGSINNSISCMNCKTTTTPLWRRDPMTGSHLCNRCGLYLKTYNVMHPLTRIKRRAIGTASAQRRVQDKQTAAEGGSTENELDDVEQIPRPANCNPLQLQYLPTNGPRQKRRITPKQQMSLGMTPKCFNCSAEKTPLWRRDTEDNIICNACGLYYKLHGKVRPVSMKRAAIKRRNRTTAAGGIQRQQQQQQGEDKGQSVPAPEDNECSNSEVGPARADAGGMGGLDFLMKAAELQLSPQGAADFSAASFSKSRKPSASRNFMLESLASIATAEMMSSSMSVESQSRELPLQRFVEKETDSRGRVGGTSGVDLTSDAKEKLRLECQRLEQLLAQSRAILGSLE